MLMPPCVTHLVKQMHLPVIMHAVNLDVKYKMSNVINKVLTD